MSANFLCAWFSSSFFFSLLLCHRFLPSLLILFSFFFCFFIAAKLFATSPCRPTGKAQDSPPSRNWLAPYKRKKKKERRSKKEGNKLNLFTDATHVRCFPIQQGNQIQNSQLFVCGVEQPVYMGHSWVNVGMIKVAPPQLVARWSLTPFFFFFFPCTRRTC